ncbi:cadherin-related family member 4 [Apteryx rowi]|uniref:cadherin-related family member 4 n=1 Tax=Apteryx rowi TaxID=308060 RepID=UPI000E1DED1E|nr:cadherin-related family member 4 [Apteryx rowi]
MPHPTALGLDQELQVAGIVPGPGWCPAPMATSSGASQTELSTAMGTHSRLTFLLLLLAFQAPGSFVRAAALLSLPRIVTVSEDAAPGTLVAKVTLACSNVSSNPRVTLAHVEPSSPFDRNVTLRSVEPGDPFNPIAISTNRTPASTFQAEITLRAGAALDAHRVNQYVLMLRVACQEEDEAEGQLFIRVMEAQVLHCAARFASTEGDVVQVPADVAPQTPLYTVVSSQLARELTFYLKNNDTPLVLTERGTVLAPASGFNPRHSTQVFRLEIVVMDRHGHNCSGAVTVEVLPSRHPQVNFTEPWRAVTVLEGTGPLEVVTQVHASGDNVRYVILAPATPSLFTIDAMTGEIRSAHRLDLERFPQAAHTQLLIQAYDKLNPTDHATVTLNITMKRMNQQAPRCTPSLYVSQVPETVPPGRTLVVLRCTDPASPSSSLHYAVEGAPASRSLFRMEGPQLQVNATLDYDSKAAAAVGFQFAATIVVTAGSQPPRSTHVPVLVTVTPVNEYTPVCPNDTAFTVLETAAFGTAVGRIAGTDRDYPPDSIKYSLEGGLGSAQPFSIDAHTGKIYVVGPLDYERQKSYRLTVRLTDNHNDLDPENQQSCLCDVAVRLQAVLNEAPVCTPEVLELRITSKPATRQPVTRLACQGSRDGATLSYAIIRGNEDRHFRLEGNTLFHVPNGLAEPRTFVLLVEVWSGPSVPRRSTTVMLVVHVVPRTTTVLPRTTVQRTTMWKEPLIITRTETTWSPPAWFVAALTVSGALLLAALGCTAQTLLQSARDRGKLLLDDREGVLGGGVPSGRMKRTGMLRIGELKSHEGGMAWLEAPGSSCPPVCSSWDLAEQRAGAPQRGKEERGHPDAGSLVQFDGRAQDPRTGRDYLFNSVTGVRRWV